MAVYRYEVSGEPVAAFKSLTRRHERPDYNNARRCWIIDLDRQVMNTRQITKRPVALEIEFHQQDNFSSTDIGQLIRFVVDATSGIVFSDSKCIVSVKAHRKEVIANPCTILYVSEVEEE